MNSTEVKQAICHKILGTTFKDIERAMDAVIKERQLTPSQEEELELKELVPEKFESFDPYIEFKLNKKAADPKKNAGGYKTYTQEEVTELLNASDAPYEQPPMLTMPKSYPTYTREQVQELMREHNDYADRNKKEEEKRKQWGSQKMTEFDGRTVTKQKRMNSSKD